MIGITLQVFKARLSGESRLRRLILSAVLGIASGFSFAPYYFWPSMLVAFCGLVWLLDTRRGGACSGVRMVFGFGQFAVGLYWIAIAFQF